VTRYFFRYLREARRKTDRYPTSFAASPRSTNLPPAPCNQGGLRLRPTTLTRSRHEVDRTRPEAIAASNQLNRSILIVVAAPRISVSRILHLSRHSMTAFGPEQRRGTSAIPPLSGDKPTSGERTENDAFDPHATLVSRVSSSSCRPALLTLADGSTIRLEGVHALHGSAVSLTEPTRTRSSTDDCDLFASPLDYLARIFGLSHFRQNPTFFCD